MSFKLWLEGHAKRFAIFLDFHDTLVDFENNKPRPHVHEFVRQLKELAPTCILTHAKTGEVSEVAAGLNIDLPVYGVDEYGRVEDSGNAVLVDDRPASDRRTRQKMKVLGIGEDRVIHVKPWHGGEDDELLGVVSKVKKLLNVREWVERNPQPLPDHQPFKTYAKARDLAKEREDKFKKGMREAAGGHRVVSSIKTKRSFKNKTVKRGKSPEKVRDVLRGAILVDGKGQIDKVVDNLRKIFIIKKVDHKTKPEKPFGYYGSVHVDVVINDMICEIQIMTKRLWKYKLKTDEIYRKYRGNKKPPKEEVERSKELFRKANGD